MPSRGFRKGAISACFAKSMKNIGLCWLISSLCICFSPYYRCFCFLFAFAVFYLFSLFYLLQKKIVYVFQTFFIYTLINVCSFVFAGFCCAIKKTSKIFCGLFVLLMFLFSGTKFQSQVTKNKMPNYFQCWMLYKNMQ